MKPLFLLWGFLGLVVTAGSQPLWLEATEANRIFEPLIVPVLEDAGFKVTVKYVPLARMQSNLKNGDSDGAFLIGEASLGPTGALKVPVPLFDNEVVAVTVKPGITIRSRDDLKGFTVGILRGNKDQLTLTQGLVVEETDSYETSLRMLKAHRFEVALISRLLVRSLATTVGLEGYAVQEPPLVRYPLYLALSTRRTADFDRVTRAFQAAVEAKEWKGRSEAVLR